jgi:colanic acid biosynthesis glycosyl transferase WcaI
VQSYLAAGRPLLGMLDGEGARVIVEAGAGLVCAAGDGKGLADCVLSLARMGIDERGAMGRRAQAYGKEQFDRSRLLGQVEAWLQDAGRLV